MRDRSSRPSAFSVDVDLVTATRNQLAVLLARNSSERERWSLPWRPSQTGETFELAATRSAQEALGEAPSWMEQIGAFGEGKRHPSDADISVGYVALVPHETASPRAGYTWFQIADLPPL
ncbi:MAG TPA: NUDIX domain-containing protein, partial [Gemmatimonadaceae bacterium]|nr:NUDIX domain-containing protein [Gemmatimonadaceae bacterium]